MMIYDYTHSSHVRRPTMPSSDDVCDVYEDGTKDRLRMFL